MGSFSGSAISFLCSESGARRTPYYSMRLVYGLTCAPPRPAHPLLLAWTQGPCVRVTAIAPEILKGETLTIDYNAMEVDIISSFDCACGAVNCRGHISGFSKLPPSVQEEYIQGRWLTSQVGTEGSGAPPLLTGVVKDWVATTRRVRGS